MEKVMGNPTVTPINIRNFVGKASSINNKASGESIHLMDSSNEKLNNLIIYGKTTQAAEPTLEAPQELVSVGAEPFNVLVTGNNLFKPTAISTRPETALVEYSNTKIETGTTYNSSDGIVVKVIDSASSNSSYFYMHFETPHLKLNHDYTLIADVIVDNNYNDPTSTTYNEISFRTQNGPPIVSAKVDVTNGKIAAYIPADKMIPSTREEYAHLMWIQCILNKKDITLKNIMLLPGDWTNNPPEYEDYKEQELTIEEKITMGSADNIAGLVAIPVNSSGNYTDENGQNWIANTIDFNEGKHYRRVMGRRIPWTGWEWADIADDGDGIFYCDTDWPYGGYSEVLSNYFPYKEVITFDTIGPGIKITNNNGYISFVLKTSITEASELEDFINTNRPYVYYVSITVVPQTLSNAELEQYKALTTNYPITRVISDEDVGMEVEYVSDTKNYIDNKFAELTALILEG